MNNTHIHLFVVWAWIGLMALIPQSMIAQDIESTVFVVIDYMKVQPENEATYVEMETKVWKPVHQKRKNENRLTDWHLYKVLIPFGSETEYNYVTVNIYTGPKMLAGHYSDWGVDFERFLDLEQKALFMKTNEVRSLVRQVVFRFNEGIESNDFKTNPPKYLAMNYMKLHKGITTEEYSTMEKEIWKPLHSSRIDAGIMQGWSLYTLELPYGSNMPFQASTVDYFQKFEDINAPYFNEMFPKVHVGKDAVRMMERTENARDLLQADILEVMLRLD